MRSRRTRMAALGVALVAYGAIGIVMFLAIAVGVARPLDRAGELSASVDKDRASLVASLTQAETTIRGMSTSVDNMGTSLTNTRTAIDRATTIAHGLATSMYDLRDAMGVSILGAQPLAGLAGSFDTSGQNLDALGDNIAAIGTALDANHADVLTTSQNLTALADSVHDLTTSVEDGPALAISPRTLDTIRFAVYAVTLWLVILAAGCIVAGLYMIRYARRT